MERSWLKIIHVAKRECGLNDDEYRALLNSAAGVSSASDLKNVSQFQAVMKAFEKTGFGKKIEEPCNGDEQLAKAYAIWCNLHLLGAVNDKSFKAMMSWTKRMYPQDILRRSQKSQLIEALKRWDARVTVARRKEAMLKEGVDGTK